MRLWTYRLARGAGHSRWRSFCAAFFGAELPDRTEEIQAELMDLWKSDSEFVKQKALEMLVSEYDRLMVSNYRNPRVYHAYLDKIRKVDPELAQRVGMQQNANMTDHLARHGLD
jgi:hypothetical protein